MALYSMKDVQDTKYSKPDFRTLKIEEGLKNAKKLWIPEFKFAYKRIHFNVQKFTKFTQSKFNTLDCFNQMLGAKGKGCPICATIDELWDKWRATKDKEEKKKLTGIINRILAEEYWLNVIDLSDPNKAFTAARFTLTRFLDIKDAAKDAEQKGQDISDLIFTFSMKKEGLNVKYSLTWDNDQKEKTEALQDQFDTLMGRAYEDGGPIDLEKVISSRTRTIDEYNDILHNEGGDEQDHASEESTPAETRKKDTPPKKDKAPSKEKEPKLEEESLSLDDVGLSEDDLGEGFEEEKESEVPPTPKVVMIEIDAKKIIEEKNNKDYILPLEKHLIEIKKIKASEGYADKVKATFAYVKEAKTITVPESLWKKPEPVKKDDDLDLNLD